ncbi:MAG TPA: hypothetical protein PKY54_11950 [Chitinophagales bacterium]|nr:hypothetical protein [Chitinophagales bacterium]
MKIAFYKKMTLYMLSIFGRLGVAGNLAQGALQNKVYNLFRPQRNPVAYNFPEHVKQTFRSHAAAQAADDNLGVQDGNNV